LPLERGGVRVPSADLVPPDIVPAGRFTLAIYALFFQGEQQGLLAFDVTSADQGMVFSTIRGQTSTAIHGALLVRQLEARATELERAHEVQREQQRRLLVSEKLASLGRLTAGSAHELNTPLAAVRTARSELGSLADGLATSLGDPE